MSKSDHPKPTDLDAIITSDTQNNPEVLKVLCKSLALSLQMLDGQPEENLTSSWLLKNWRQLVKDPSTIGPSSSTVASVCNLIDSISEWTRKA